MALEAESVVEAVGLFTLQVAGEHKLVTLGLAALLARMFHHGAANAAAPERRVDSHIFDNAGFFAALGEVIHDKEFICADDRVIEYCDEDTIRGIALEHPQLVASFFESE